MTPEIEYLGCMEIIYSALFQLDEIE